ncbi:MAG TPA: cupin domain-containing protein [Acidobacteriaceae bacterium]|nr:cupin domain-containing protein [Acidobacteriaceae bacterium]
MALTRRELCILMPAFMAAATGPGTAAENHDTSDHALPSAIYNLKDLPVQGDKQHEFIPVFKGNTSAGMHVDLHESVLAPGGLVHGLYSHVGDELFLVREGTLEVEFNGKRSEIGPGSVAYVASNTIYAVRNTGKEWARYFVFLFGPSHVPASWRPAIQR